MIKANALKGMQENLVKLYGPGIYYVYYESSIKQDYPEVSLKAAIKAIETSKNLICVNKKEYDDMDFKDDYFMFFFREV